MSVCAERKKPFFALFLGFGSMFAIFGALSEKNGRLFANLRALFAKNGELFASLRSLRGSWQRLFANHGALFGIFRSLFASQRGLRGIFRGLVGLHRQRARANHKLARATLCRRRTRNNADAPSNAMLPGSWATTAKQNQRTNGTEHRCGRFGDGRHVHADACDDSAGHLTPCAAEIRLVIP